MTCNCLQPQRLERSRLELFRAMMIAMACGCARLACVMFLATVGIQSACCAGEQVVVRFQESPRTSGYVVRLGDLVELLSGQSASMEKLLEIPLGPAPRANQTQTWHSSDVMQHLELRGVHPASIRWSGETKTTLARVAELDVTEIASMTPAFLQQRTIQQAETLVAQVIREYITFKSGDRVDWEVSVSVPDRLAKTLQSKRNILSIGGGQEPWTGDQEFVLQIMDQGNASTANFKANVAMPAMVVTAVRPLRRDEVLTTEALTFGPVPKNSRTSSDVEYFTTVEPLIGKQLRRAVSTGVALQVDYVGDPILVTRNALIQVESVAGAVVVRTQAKALGSGAAGDLIEVELLSNRQRIHATIVDSMSARVAAQPTRTTR